MNYWDEILQMESGRLEVVNDIVRSGSSAARFEVHPGDLVKNGERCEVITMRVTGNTYIIENEGSGTQWYAFSVRLGTDWTPPVWGICLQLHAPAVDLAPPAISVRMTDKFYLTLCSGDIDVAQNSIFQKDYAFSNGDLSLGNWVDFALKIKYAADFTGEVEVWRRDTPTGAFTRVLNLAGVPTLQYRSSLGGVGDHGWSQGIYRYPSDFTSVVWMDCLTRATDFDSAVVGAFGS